MGLRKRWTDLIEKRHGKEVAIQERMNGRYFYSKILSAYENLFAQLRPLINEMKGVFPYGVTAKGDRLPLQRTPELEALQDPNDQMGLDEFLDLAFAIWLTESELNIRVHFGKHNQVIGYTILPVGSRLSYLDAYEDKFQVYTADGKYETLTSAEVMTLRFSRSPKNINKGVSPASSVLIWTEVDDLMAQFQRGFFENGAVPATITTIRASSHARFMEVRNDLEKAFKGADNNNKTLYLWREQLDDGSVADQVEVKPIQGHNSTLALEELYKIICDKLNKSVGVSNFILGDDSSAKYDNAELSDYIFTKRRVAPALKAFWGGFQHELDRIYAERGMNGLGYALELDIELPELTDRRRTQAETAKINAETMISLIRAGAKPKKVVEALGLPAEWEAVAKGINPEALPATILPATPVDHLKIQTKALPRATSHEDAKNGQTSPENGQTQGEITEAEDGVKDAKRENGQTSREKTEVKVSVKDAKTQLWEVPKGLDEGQKEIFDILMRCAYQLAEEDPTYDLKEAKKEIMEILKTYSERGAAEGAKILQMFAIGKEAEEYLKSSYVMSDEVARETDERLQEVLSGYEDDTRELVKEVMERRAAEGMTLQEVKKALQEKLSPERAELIAREETHTAINVGRYDLDQQMAERYGLEIYLVCDAHLDSATCETCAAMNGQEVRLGEAFPDHVTSKDGVEIAVEHTKYNLNGKLPTTHPRCRCTFNEKVRRKA